MSYGLTPIGALGRDLLDAHREARGMLLLTALRQRWPTAVGELIARHSLPSRLRGTLLVIAVDNPLWAQTLSGQAPLILDRVRAACPGLRVDNLRCELDYERVKAAAAAAAAPPPRVTNPEIAAVELSAAQHERIAQAAAAITDPQLRATFARAMTASLQRATWRRDHGWTLDPRTHDLRPPPGELDPEA